MYIVCHFFIKFTSNDANYIKCIKSCNKISPTEKANLIINDYVCDMVLKCSKTPVKHLRYFSL